MPAHEVGHFISLDEPGGPVDLTARDGDYYLRDTFAHASPVPGEGSVIKVDPSEVIKYETKTVMDATVVPLEAA